ncbi:MAG TPA: hypothetical protein VKK79_02285 [Candidatus Lokiarchaeia archaeon]|nr:hypothetical protein [Candidatus Lokiarchaeia archaeon]
MVNYLTIKRNYSLAEVLSQSEMSMIERISDEIGKPIRIEPIHQGIIVYLGDVFPQDFFFQLRDVILQNVDIVGESDLPEQYSEWYDSITRETYYFQTSGENYLRTLTNFIYNFIGDERAAELIEHLKDRFSDKSENSHSN